MVQVEFFETNNIWKLEEQVNKFLNQISDNYLIDVKYNQMSSNLPQNNDDDWNVLYSAMVLYSGPKVKRV